MGLCGFCHKVECGNPGCRHNFSEDVGYQV
jgi:hypothetical protein